jgi:type VI secretion system protein ImpE
MTAQDLLRQGKLQEAIHAVGGELRDHPADSRRRTFLFELLCFAGEYDRAGKHLSVLAEASEDAATGALVYRSALSAERKRHALFEGGKPAEPPAAASRPRPGKLNGEPFQTLEDIDPRIGPRLEVFVAGEYVWLPLAHIASLRIEAPRRLRDLIWAEARIMTGPGLKGQDMGEVLLPVLYPYSWKHPSESVRLGRETDWVLEGDDSIETPYGQKLLLLDNQKAIPFLEIRTLEFDAAAASAEAFAEPA